MIKISLSTRLLITLFLIVSAFPIQKAHSSNDDPIAFSGHGALFDRNGNEIKVTPEFIKETLKFYLDMLSMQADDKQKEMLSQKRRKFLGRQWGLRNELYINSALIEWLINQVNFKNADDIRGKIKFLQQKIMSPKLKFDPTDIEKNEKPFELPNELKLLLDKELISQLKGKTLTTLSTNLSGAAYIAQCNAAGVPTPPDWGTGGWVSKGTIDKEFISEEKEAEVFTFNSNTPEGMCIALPRSIDNTINLLGIICLGKFSSTACFWDNQKDGVSFDIQKGNVVPISQFTGGADLVKGSVGPGICTSCHAGENPYIIHPETNLGLPNLAGLPLRGNDWYKPLVHPNWPQNKSPTNILDSVSSTEKCTRCHTKTGGGGRFPGLSTKLAGFCQTILPRALERTMPPDRLNYSKYIAHINALLAACAKNPDSDGDGIDDEDDNCPSVANPDQRNTDTVQGRPDDFGDACDDDDDNDSCSDNEDQHPLEGNPIVATLPSVPNTCPSKVRTVFEGEDSDLDGILNCNDTDDDNDGIPDNNPDGTPNDRCPTVKDDGSNPLLIGCGFGITDCPRIPKDPLGACFGIKCITDFRAKLEWIVNPANPPFEVAIFDRFWIEGNSIYISGKSLKDGQTSLQQIVSKLSNPPNLDQTGRFRLSIWSRETKSANSTLKAVVAEYRPDQILLSGNITSASSIQISLPETSSGKILIQASNKTEPANMDSKAYDNSSYLLAIIIVGVLGAMIVIGARR